MRQQTDPVFMIDVSEEGEEEVVEPPSMVLCWRCELESPEGLNICPHCDASLGSRAHQSAREADSKSTEFAFKVLIWSFVLLMATTIFFAIATTASTNADGLIDDQVIHQLLTQILVTEGIDTLIVLAAILMCARSVPPTSNPGSKPVRAWLIFVPLLAVMLILNLGYHWLLREILQVPVFEEVLTFEFSKLVLLTHCIQPAIVEEFYCRGFVLKVLHGVSGKHSAVWISAILFGLLHVGVPLSVPYLILLGGVLGYARLASNGILLPIVLHFIHNLFIMLWN